MSWARTRRLALREFGPDDEDDLVQMHLDPRVSTWLIDDLPLHEPALARRFIQHMAQVYRLYEGVGAWHVTLLHPRPCFVGFYSLMPIARWPGEIELGGRLVPAAWGRGLAMEGGELLLEHAFERLGFDRVWAVCSPDNGSAKLLNAALGFEPLAVAPRPGPPASHWRIDASTWRQRRNESRSVRLRRALRAAA